MLLLTSGAQALDATQPEKSKQKQLSANAFWASDSYIIQAPDGGRTQLRGFNIHGQVIGLHAQQGVLWRVHTPIDRSIVDASLATLQDSLFAIAASAAIELQSAPLFIALMKRGKEGVVFYRTIGFQPPSTYSGLL